MRQICIFLEYSSFYFRCYTTSRYRSKHELKSKVTASTALRFLQEKKQCIALFYCRNAIKIFVPVSAKVDCDIVYVAVTMPCKECDRLAIFALYHLRPFNVIISSSSVVNVMYNCSK